MNLAVLYFHVKTCQSLRWIGSPWCVHVSVYETVPLKPSGDVRVQIQVSKLCITDGKAFALGLKMDLRIAVHCVFQMYQGLLHRSMEVKCWFAVLFPLHLGLGELVVGGEDLASGAFHCVKEGDSL